MKKREQKRARRQRFGFAVRDLARAAIVAIGLCLSLAAYAQTTSPKVDFVYLGGSDCPHCRGWEAVDLKKLQASPTFQKIRFTHVKKSISSPVPAAFWFPEEIKHLRDPIAERLPGAGSPMFAILKDANVVTSWKGTQKSPEEIVAILEQQIRVAAPAPARGMPAR